LGIAQPNDGDYMMACGLAFNSPGDHTDPKTKASLVNFKRRDGSITYIRTWGSYSFPSN